MRVSLTDDRHGNIRAATIDLVYDFSPRRLQTAVAQVSIARPNGTELDCGVAKITPELGIAGSVFEFAPVGMLVLTGASHIAAKNAFWSTVLDLSRLLRHLQFVFTSAAMRVEFPGFYVPVASKLAWANLLYWRGVLDHGYSYVGVDGGMYVSNYSNGYQFMTQTLGYPNMLNTLANSLLNLAILATPVFFLITFALLKTKGESPGATVKKAAGITLGLALCLFSVPLLSYMAYDLVLVGYLPNYRIALAVAMVLVMMGANYFMVGQIDGQIKLGEAESQLRRLWHTVARYAPHSMPLVQAIAVGGLQDFPVAQIAVTGTCEVVFLLFESSVTWPRVSCSCLRLAVTVLVAPLVDMQRDEVVRQRLGYVMLVLHGLAMGVFVVDAGWRIYLAFRSKRRAGGVVRQALPMRSLPSRSSSPSQCRKSPPRDWQSDMFYRQPRASTLDYMSSESTGSMESVELQEQPFNLGSVLLQLPTKNRVDYSFREADLFYGVPEDSSSTEQSLEEPTGSGRSRWSWRAKPKKEEKGFSVVRPPRPEPPV